MSTHRALVVDSNPADIWLLSTTLVSLGLAWDETTTLSGAVKLLKTEPYDIIIADTNLSDSSGLGTVRTLLELACGIPLVILTGLDDEDVAIAAVRMGVQDWMKKGEANGNLRRAIRFAAARHQERCDAERELQEHIRRSFAPLVAESR